MPTGVRKGLSGWRGTLPWGIDGSITLPLDYLILGSQTESKGTLLEKWPSPAPRVGSHSVDSGFSANACTPLFPGCLTLISQSEMSNYWWVSCLLCVQLRDAKSREDKGQEVFTTHLFRFLTASEKKVPVGRGRSRCEVQPSHSAEQVRLQSH